MDHYQIIRQHALVTLIHTTTQGNPLFIQEVAHQLRQQGVLRDQHGRTVAAVSLTDVRLPAQIKSALALRVQALTPACRRILALTACLGEHASFQTLQAVSGMDALPLLDLLDEGVQQDILESAREGFQFAHPLLRYVLYSELSAVRRQYLHHQIATVLIGLTSAQQESCPQEIAHHLIAAGPLAERDTVVAYARQAGDQACQMFAWQEAAQSYEAALATAGERLPLAERAALHYRAGLAYYRDQDLAPCLAHYDHAIAAYRTLDDVQGLATALMDKTEMQYTLAALPLGVQPDLQPLEEVLERLGEEAPGLRGRIYTVMSQAARFGRQEGCAQTLAQHALALGQELVDDELCALAHLALGLAYVPSFQLHQAIESWQNALVTARRNQNLQLQGFPLARMPLCLLLLGRLDEAAAVASEGYAFTRALHNWGPGVSVALSHLASTSVARGDFAATERYTAETMQAMSRSGYPWGGFRALLALACAHTLRGAWHEADAALHRLVEPGGVFQEPGAVLRMVTTIFRHLVYVSAGQREAPLPFQIADVMAPLGTDAYALAPLCALVELAHRLAMPSLAIPPYRVLRGIADQGACFSSGWVYLLPHVLGVAAMLQHRWEEAETHFHTAVEVATKSHAWPELARTYLDHAHMLVMRGARGDQPRVWILRKRAVPLVNQLGMQPWLQCNPQYTNVQ